MDPAQQNKTPTDNGVAAGAASASSQSHLQKIFYSRGTSELRAGWRLLIYFAIFFAVQRGLFILSFVLFRPRGSQFQQPKELTPTLLYFFDTITLGAALFAAFVMSKIERRKMGAYGLPLRHAFRGKFWLGIAWGFGAITMLLTVLWLAHDLNFGGAALHGGAVVWHALAWAGAFLLVGLSEEFVFRGYLQYVLTTGISFWPAAILGSLYFAYVHRSNSGEQWLGLGQVVIIALFFCFTVWRTGTLWFAVGYHAAWDWGQTFFYGTSDSGLPGRGHLLNSSFHGPAWLTGGSVGPEGSVLNIPLVLMVWILFHFLVRKGLPYPDLSRPRPAREPVLPAPPSDTATM